MYNNVKFLGKTTSRDATPSRRGDIVEVAKNPLR
jgi:hypothetical protein